MEHSTTRVPAASIAPMKPEAPAADARACSTAGGLGRRHFHPLEIIPFFRRIQRTFLRDLAYTFVWNCGFGLFFYALGTLGAGQLQGWLYFGIYMFISNVIGYTIHFLYSAGTALNLDTAARNAGRLATAAYFSLIPTSGVLLGLWIASFFIDVGIEGMLHSPAAIMQVLSISLVISVVLSFVFFLRERGAVAEANLARERERFERAERGATLANLRALQAQIEPHFLFNTLANVTGLIDLDPAKAKHMLETFIRFLRASLAATRSDSTTLAAEAELIGSYLDVLEVRMGSRLRYVIDVDPALAGYALPPMLLQPLVENAIRHGLEPKIEGGEIAFRARQEGSEVVLQVSDTGVGFAPTTAGGIGLTNLRDRLRLLYGERASFAIRESAPSGTTVTIRIPA